MPPPAASTVADNAAEPDRTRKAAKYTRHMRVHRLGESQDEALFVLLGFRHLMIFTDVR